MARYSSWTTLPLQHVVLKWFGGATPNRSNEGYFSDGENGIPWARVSDLQERLLFETQAHLSEEALRENVRLVPKDVVLLSTSGTIGKVAITGSEMAMNQAIQGMLFHPEMLLPEYAYYYFLFSKERLRSVANAVTIPNLTRARLKSFEISFPSLEEQQFIIDKLIRMEDSLAKQKQLVTMYEKPVASLFFKMFGAAIDHAQMGTLAELSDTIAGVRLKQTDSESDLSLLNALPSHTLSTSDPSSGVKIDTSTRGIEQYHVLPGDVLVCRNAVDGFAVAALAGDGMSDTIVGANLIRVRTSRAHLLPEFLLAWLTVNRGRLFPAADAAQPLDVNKIRNLYVPCVSLALQSKFAEQFRKLCAMQEKLVKAAAHAEKLFDSMLTYAFFNRQLSASFRRERGVPEAPDHKISNYYTISKQDIAAGAGQDKRIHWRDIFASEPQKIDFVQLLSPFQQALLREFYSLKSPLAAHTVLRNVKRKVGSQFNRYGVQDALLTVRLFTNFGLIHELPPQKIPEREGEDAYLQDARAAYITVQQYQAPEDLLENAHETT